MGDMLFSAFLGCCIGVALGVTLGSLLVLGDFKKQAFERGYMVECLGKSGYYWECDE